MVLVLPWRADETEAGIERARMQAPPVGVDVSDDASVRAEVLGRSSDQQCGLFSLWSSLRRSRNSIRRPGTASSPLMSRARACGIAARLWP